MRKEHLFEGMRGRIDDRVILAMAKVPRELFIPESYKSNAYEDTPLPIGYGQTISAPHMVAIMCVLLDLQNAMQILEIGGGSGYHAAVMANLVKPDGHVFSIERIPELVAQARENLRNAGVVNVSMIEGDGSTGLLEHAPFDRISVAATAPRVPEPLKQQLKVGGKMVIPVGTTFQELILLKRKNGFYIEEKMGVAFVPLIGEHGFKE
ncbi:MAG: protein-L-isoaspartate(D-aspartate) O-methyltransferase [Methanotrichaceae archaeon]|nr:protein-L-isoaspartate(D-aspartate) O-methyltransferase [Methanotrichaceae archaeon]